MFKFEHLYFNYWTHCANAEEIALIERVTDSLLVGAKVGRKGWKARRRAEIRKQVCERLVVWKKAEFNSALAFSRYQHDQRVLAVKAANDAAGIVRLSDIYGHSYFGSGGGWGGVTLVNAEVHEIGDNGFIRGPVAIRVLDRSQHASVLARGGDCINEGREWRDAWIWNPASQSWELASHPGEAPSVHKMYFLDSTVW